MWKYIVYKQKTCQQPVHFERAVNSTQWELNKQNIMYVDYKPLQWQIQTYAVVTRSTKISGLNGIHLDTKCSVALTNNWATQPTDLIDHALSLYESLKDEWINWSKIYKMSYTVYLNCWWKIWQTKDHLQLYKYLEKRSFINVWLSRIWRQWWTILKCGIKLFDTLQQVGLKDNDDDEIALITKKT